MMWSIADTESTRPVICNGAMDIRESSNQFAYNFNGSLTQDGTRNIALIEYDDWKNPRRIQFANDNVTKYVYTAKGVKLRTIHYTAMPNITVEYGKKHELSQEEILSVDSTDYLLGGTAIYENGKFSKYLFDEGYIGKDASVGNTQELSAYYFNKDHLGNIREVVDENGRVLQIDNYYPFGMPYTDNPTDNASLQKYKYNGKELDLVHGLNTYDYGARQYNPVIPSWDRVDPLSEKYYNTSPYVYCGNTPANAIDPDGKLVLFINGQHVGSGRNSTYWEGVDKVIMDKIGDKHAFYIDGASGGWSSTLNWGHNLSIENRINDGFEYGFKYAQSIIESAQKKNESIKVITHSMGGAFGKGLIEGICFYGKLHKIDVEKLVEFEIDLAPYQPTEQQPVGGIPTIILSHFYDGVAGASPMPYAKNHTTRTNIPINSHSYLVTMLQEHQIKSFIEDVKRFVPKSKRNGKD